MNLHLLFKTVLTVTLIGFGGCSSGGDKLDQSEQVINPLNVTSITAVTGSDGVALVPFTVNPGTSAFSLTAFTTDTTENLLFSFLELIDPAGSVVANSQTIFAFTDQELYNASPITVNYPSSPGKLGQLVPGTYLIKIGAKRNRSGDLLPRRSLTVAYTSKSDSGNFSGKAKVYVNAILSGAVADDQRNRDSIKIALAKVQEMFRRRDIELAVTVHRRGDFPSILPNPAVIDGNLLYEIIGNSFPFAVNLIFGTDVDNLSFPDNEYAQGGFIPVPAIPSKRSVVALSVRDLAGPDGEFDKDRDENDLDFQEYDDETLQMASVIAHELGHALGLANTVTIDGEQAVYSDTLSDTLSCIDRTNCESERDINRNIMFPFSLKKRGSDNEFWVRDSLSSQQAIIIKQNVLTILE